MNQIAAWHVVYTRPRWEKKVAETLSRKNIEIYCPLNKVQRQWHDRKKMVHEPLFPSYVFVKATPAQHSLIKDAAGIINFVYWLGKPAVIRPVEIDAIRAFLADYQNVRVEKIEVNPKDLVRIIQGPLINQEGNVVEVLKRTVKVTVPSLGYSLVAEVQKSHIEVI